MFTRPDISIELVENLMDDLRAAFTWEDSPQGHDYWETVYNDLQRVIVHKVKSEENV